MSPFGIIMGIFGICIILFGLYAYTGHKIYMRQYVYKDLSKEELKKLGRVLMIVGLSPILCAISTLIFEENSIMPAVILIGSFILLIIWSVKHKWDKNKEE